MTNKTIFAALASVAAIASFPTAAQAESRFVTGAGPLTANANLDFRIVIPKFVYVRIGTGTVVADNATVDELVYTVPAANIGDATPIAGVGGDLGPGQVTARVIGNNGTIVFSSTTLGDMENADGDTIPWSQIGVAVASNLTATPLPHPAFVNGGGQTDINLPTTTGSKVTLLDASWTFTYLNQDIVPSGTYGGVNTQNGRVSYGVSMP